MARDKETARIYMSNYRASQRLKKNAKVGEIIDGPQTKWLKAFESVGLKEKDIALVLLKIIKGESNPVGTAKNGKREKEKPSYKDKIAAIDAYQRLTGKEQAATTIDSNDIFSKMSEADAKEELQGLLTMLKSEEIQTTEEKKN